MDTIVREAGVGNATVYRQFPTKDHLAAAYVQERADAWFERMRAAADRVDDPRDKVLAVFTVTADDITRPTFRGCPMLNTHTEFPDAGHPAHAVAVTHKQEVRSWLLELVERSGAREPATLADELLLVLNGTLATAAVLGPDGPARQGLALARSLLAASCGGTASDG
jgi:AcrR family transcriptional regulator